MLCLLSPFDILTLYLHSKVKSVRVKKKKKKTLNTDIKLTFPIDHSVTSSPGI